MAIKVFVGSLTVKQRVELMKKDVFKVLPMFLFEGVSRLLQEFFKIVSRLLQRRLKDVLRAFQRYLKGVSKSFISVGGGANDNIFPF